MADQLWHHALKFLDKYRYVQTKHENFKTELKFKKTGCQERKPHATLWTCTSLLTTLEFLICTKGC